MDLYNLQPLLVDNIAKQESKDLIVLDMSTLVSPLICNQRLYYPLQFIFRHLSIRDLSMLACVSKQFYGDINTYCEGLSKVLLLENSLHRFFESQLILNEEAETQRKLMEGKYTFKWLFVEGMKLKRIYRKSVTQFQMWISDQQYIVRTYDDALRREIAEIKYVRCFQFAHTYRSVAAGNYRAILRMNINGVSWSSDEGTAKILIHWEDRNGFHDMKAEILWFEWGLLSDALQEGNSINLLGAPECKCESRNDWFDFSLQEFHLSEICDVTFEFKDMENNGWKTGMRWDYVELNPIDWDSR